MGNFTGTLNANTIFSSIYNMIISQQVFADNLGAGFGLVDKARTDGSMFGDTKLFYATDVLESQPWTNDSEATNLLALARPKAPKVQALVINVFRQIRLTVSNYLEKQAWGTEGAFSQFNSVMQGWVRETKKVYDQTTYNAFCGTAKSSATINSLNITLSGITATGEEKNRLRAQMISQQLADLKIDLKDFTRNYNEYAFLRSNDDVSFIWNSAYVNEITKLDIPTIFHSSDVLISEENVLPSRYFGNVNSSAGTTGSSNTTVRSLIETDYGSTHVFAGDLLPNSTAYAANATYTQDPKIIAIAYKKLPPFMSGFEVATDFFNPRSLTTTQFLTYGHSTLELLKNYCWVRIKEN